MAGLLSKSRALERRARGRGTPLREASQNFRAEWLLGGRYTKYDSRTYRWSEMRKLVVLMVIVALVSSVTAVLAGCGPSAPTDQAATAPTETTSPLLTPTANASTPPVDDSVSTPTPASSAPTDQPAAAPTETASPLLTPRPPNLLLQWTTPCQHRLPRRLTATGLNSGPPALPERPGRRNP